MASASSLLTEEQLLCSICLDVFSDPVSIPCGHNYCLPCITKYWDTNNICQCPMCKEKFYVRPMLRVNTFISEVAAQFKRSAKVKAASSTEQQPDNSGNVLCDICTGAKCAALKSCLVCLISYCDTHLEPHQRISALKRHKLINPVENLDSRMCKKHDRPLELFCKADHMFLCELCTETDHKTHKTVTLEEEYEERKAYLGMAETEVHKMMQDRQQKILELQHSVETSRHDSEKVLSDSVQAINALGHYIKRCQAELIEVIEEKQKRIEGQAEGFIKELVGEVTELLHKSTELKQISLSEDHFHFLQSFPCLPIPPPQTKDWSKVSVQCDPYTAGIAVVEMEMTVMREVKRVCDPDLKIMQRHAVDLTLDPDTAHPNLILSEDGKQVKHGDRKRNLLNKPQRFDHVLNVLAKEGFSSGRFYYEVQVKDKTLWNLGVAQESINRKGDIRLSPRNGYWTVWLRKGDTFTANAAPAITLSLREKPQKVGVFVDYEEGQVSFYDVEARAHIYSFTGCCFTEKLFPFFSPCVNDNGKNSAPLIITPAKFKD